MQRHKPAAHDAVVFKCPQHGCEYSSSTKYNLAIHLEGFHGTAGSFACDHPGCTHRTTWRHSMTCHKRHVHSDERPFVCDHTGCSFRSKRKANLSIHKNSVHLNIRYNRCHVCEKEFRLIWQLKAHMLEHEEQGHKFDKCQDCSVNLRSKLSRKTKPTAGKPVLCGHPGCNFKSKWRCSLSSHRKRFHSKERPFSCNHTGCSYRCKAKTNLTAHPNRVHLKIKTNRFHVCDKRFFFKTGLRKHMKSKHQTNVKVMDECDDGVPHLKETGRRHQAPTDSNQVRSQQRKAKAEAQQSHNRKVGKKEENSVAPTAQDESETTHRLNDDLIDAHMDMQILSSL